MAREIIKRYKNSVHVFFVGAIVVAVTLVFLGLFQDDEKTAGAYTGDPLVTSKGK